jgi:hypothetical protein
MVAALLLLPFREVMALHPWFAGILEKEMERAGSHSFLCAWYLVWGVCLSL